MTPNQLADILEPIQEAGLDVMATAASGMMASVLSAYRYFPREKQEYIVQLMVQESWRLLDAAIAEEARIKAALVLPENRSVH